MNENHCGSAIMDDASDSFNCREGCFCPDGTLLSDGICVKKEQCPCYLKGQAFPSQSKIKRDCNTCTCDKGNWKCSTITCGSRCAAIGDPHYTTFDGKRYDFMGKCSYVLMKSVNFIVEAENVACSGAFSENMNLLDSPHSTSLSSSSELPSCTKSLTIKFNDNRSLGSNDGSQLRIIRLKQGKLVLVDGYEISKLPWDSFDGNMKIRQASSSFIVGMFDSCRCRTVQFIFHIFNILTVDSKDGVKVWWDGVSRAYIDIPATYRGKTQGLCGTFNANTQDDFLTPEGE